MMRPRLIAILRGLEPDRALAVGERLVAAGLSHIEVPLNSPEPLASIASLARGLAERAVVGAGTVVDVASVAELAASGARVVVAPNCDVDVIQAACTRGLAAWPGVFTPTEAFEAIRAGCTGLKLFPASLLTPAGIAALRAVLPDRVPLVAVGGVDAPDFAAYAAAGCWGFGIGTSLFVPGRSLDEIGGRARTFVAAHDAVFGEPA